MSRLARAMIAPVTVIATLVAPGVLADPAGNGLQALAQHRPIDAGSLVLAVASAVAPGISIWRGTSGDAGRSTSRC